MHTFSVGVVSPDPIVVSNFRSVIEQIEYCQVVIGSNIASCRERLNDEPLVLLVIDQHAAPTSRSDADWGAHVRPPAIVCFDVYDPVRFACLGTDIIGFLQTPVAFEMLETMVQSFVNRHIQINGLVCEVEKLKQTIDDRKLIEKAKGILAETMGLTESDAHVFLTSLARSRRQKLGQTAACVVLQAK